MGPGFALDVGVEAVAVRVHGDDRHEILYAQMPHRLGNPELHQVDAEDLPSAVDLHRNSETQSSTCS